MGITSYHLNHISKEWPLWNKEEKDPVMVTNILSSVVNLQAYALINALIITMSENMTTWNYVVIVIIEEHERSLQRGTSQQPSAQDEATNLAVSVRKNSLRNKDSY